MHVVVNKKKRVFLCYSYLSKSLIGWVLNQLKSLTDCSVGWGEVDRGSKSKKKFSGRELHRQIRSGGSGCWSKKIPPDLWSPEVGISAIINYSIMFIYCKQHMFVIYVLPCCSSTSDAPRDSKLLNILHDARSTLSSTGRTMQKQGQQIDSACADMNKIHNEL